MHARLASLPWCAASDQLQPGSVLPAADEPAVPDDGDDPLQRRGSSRGSRADADHEDVRLLFNGKQSGLRVDDS